MEWGKRNKGVAIGIISFSESIGSTIFSIIGTAVINPHNLPTSTVGEESGYFDQPEVLDRIPYYFVGLGIATFVTLLPTSLFISLPTGKAAKCDKRASQNIILIKGFQNN